MRTTDTPEIVRLTNKFYHHLAYIGTPHTFSISKLKRMGILLTLICRLEAEEEEAKLAQAKRQEDEKRKKEFEIVNELINNMKISE